MPSWFVYLIFIGPAFYAIGLVIGALDQVDVAGDFADGTPIRGQPGDERAEQLLEDNASAGCSRSTSRARWPRRSCS